MVFLHGSYDPHPVGRRLAPQPDRTAGWAGLEFVRVLERYRPDWGIPHAEAVFLCQDPDHLDRSGNVVNYDNALLAADLSDARGVTVLPVGS